MEARTVGQASLNHYRISKRMPMRMQKKATSTKKCWCRKPLKPFSKPLRFKSGQRGIGPMQPVAHKTKGPDPLFQWIQPLYCKQLALGQAAD